MPPTTITRRAQPDDRSAVVRVVVDAFRDDPAFRYFFADNHDAEAPTAIGAWFDRRADDETVWVTSLDGKVAGVAMWEVLDSGHPAPPGSGTESDGAGAGAAPDPATTWGRIERYHEVLNPSLPAVPHWYLGILAVAAPSRGSGAARAVVTPGVNAATAAGVPAALETTNPDNVARYQHWGWEVTAEITTDDVPTIWILQKEPTVTA